MADVYPKIELAAGVEPHGRAAAVLKALARDTPEVTRTRKQRHTRHYWLGIRAKGAPTLRLFVKVYRPPWKRNLLTPLLASRARREYTNSRRAAADGLNALAAAGYGERRSFGVVVDQFVAFPLVRHAKSLSRRLLNERDPAALREELLPVYARELARLHDGGCLHLQASPRNLLLVERRGALEPVWIDLPSALFFRRSVRARLPAVADILQSFRSRLLLPDDAHRRRFLEFYAPGAARFHEQVLAMHRRRVRASLARRIVKCAAFWKGA